MSCRAGAPVVPAVVLVALIPSASVSQGPTRSVERHMPLAAFDMELCCVALCWGALGWGVSTSDDASARVAR